MAVDGGKIVAEKDFIYGWLRDNGSSAGRPVDLIFGTEDGALYVSDNEAGVVYRVTRVRQSRRRRQLYHLRPY